MSSENKEDSIIELPKEYLDELERQNVVPELYEFFHILAKMDSQIYIIMLMER